MDNARTITTPAGTYTAAACWKCSRRHLWISSENQTLQARAGDLTLCDNCGAFLIFGTDRIPREPTLLELINLPPRIRTLADAVEKQIQDRGRYE